MANVLTGTAIVGGTATVARYRAAFLVGSVLTLAAAALAWVALTETRPGKASAATAADD